MRPKKVPLMITKRMRTLVSMFIHHMRIVKIKLSANNKLLIQKQPIVTEV